MASLSLSTLTRDGAFELPSLPGLKFTAKVRRGYRYRTRLSLLSSVAFVDALGCGCLSPVTPPLLHRCLTPCPYSRTPCGHSLQTTAVTPADS